MPDSFFSNWTKHKQNVARSLGVHSVPWFEYMLKGWRWFVGLRTHTTFPRDLDLVPSTHTRWVTTSVPGDPSPLAFSGPWKHINGHKHVHIHVIVLFIKKRRCSVNIHWYELGKQEHHKGNIQSKGESPAVAEWNRQVLEINNSSIWAKIFKPEGNISRWEIHYENQNSLRLSSFHRILSMQ